MHHVPLTIAKDTARDLWRAYQTHKHYSTPIDREIMSAYQKLAQGKLVIKALESVVTAGVNEQGLPKLAITRADAQYCRLTMQGQGAATMASMKKAGRRQIIGQSFSTHFRFPDGAFPSVRWQHHEAIVPIVPLGERPKRAMQNYHILWEAEWTKAVPIDPFLLRRIGKSDMWLVLAMWDLTEVERAALAARL
jgi:hypothetical protein